MPFPFGDVFGVLVCSRLTVKGGEFSSFFVADSEANRVATSEGVDDSGRARESVVDLKLCH